MDKENDNGNRRNRDEQAEKAITHYLQIIQYSELREKEESRTVR